MLFNMHYRDSFNARYVSLLQPYSLEDYARVYFSEEEFNLWEEVAPPSTGDYKAVERLYDHMN